MSSEEYKSTQMIAQINLNGPKCAQMSLNKLKEAWICLNKLKSALINLIVFEWT